MPKKTKTPFAHHALERVSERYGIRLTRKQQQAFGRALSNPKCTIPLTRNRFACYFQGKWYLLACSEPVRTESDVVSSSENVPSRTVRTFLRLEDANDEDKRLLRHDERYLKTKNDAFHVLSQYKSTELLSPVKKTTELPELADDELPCDEIWSAERMLNTYCDEKC